MMVRIMRTNYAEAGRSDANKGSDNANKVRCEGWAGAGFQGNVPIDLKYIQNDTNITKSGDVAIYSIACGYFWRQSRTHTRTH